MHRWPTGVPTQTWVDRRIREAAERGAFEVAAGKPLDERALSQSAQEWAVQWARREGADLVAALPPALALRVARARLLDAVPTMTSEAAITRGVTEFNSEVDAAYRRPQENPPVAVPFVDLERQLVRWRALRAVTSPVPAPSPGPASQQPPVARRRRWWWTRRSRSA